MPKNFHGLPVDEENLVKNFSGIQVSDALHLAGCAERTGKAATHLRGDTYGEAVFFRHGNEDGFDQVSVMEPETRFYRTVEASLNLIFGNRIYGEALFKGRAKAFGQVAHIVERESTFLPEPFMDLPGPVCGLSQGM
jgi:hypothetical protein